MNPPLAATSPPPGSLEYWLVLNSPFVFAGLIALIGGGMLVWGVVAIRAGFRVKRTIRTMHLYSSARGEILSSAVEPRYSKGIVYHLPCIEFVYEVGGKTYRSTNILPGPFIESRDHAWAETWVAAYPVGRQIEVFYDPSDPQLCVVDRQAAPASQDAGLTIGMGGLLTVASLAILWAAFFIILPEGGKWPEEFSRPPGGASLNEPAHLSGGGTS